MKTAKSVQEKEFWLFVKVVRKRTIKRASEALLIKVKIGFAICAQELTHQIFALSAIGRF